MNDELQDLNNKGVKLFMEGKFHEAESMYMEALQTDPDHSTTLNNMGMLRLYQKEYRLALVCFNKALKQAEKPVYYLNRGHAYAHLKQFDNAIEDYKTCVSIEPSSLKGWISLARTCIAAERKNEAIQYLERVVSLDRDPVYKLELAKLLISTGSLDEARRILYTTLKSVKLKDVVLYYLGLIAFYRKNFGLASDYLQEALKLNHSNAVYRELLAAVFLAKGDAESALKEWNTVIHLHPENVKARLDSGIALLGLNYLKDADIQIRKALQLEPDNEKAQYYLALLHYKEGKTGWRAEIERIAASGSGFSKKAQNFLNSLSNNAQ
ncbi:tetratricopeptide repeat protein [Saccharicrinis sp. FJH54]